MAYGFRPHKGAIDAPFVLTLMVQLSQVLKAPLLGDRNLLHQMFGPHTPGDIHGFDGGAGNRRRSPESVPRHVRLAQAHVQEQRLPWSLVGSHEWGVAGCPLSMIVINPLATTWKCIDDVGRPVVVTTKEMPPAPKENELPSCYWSSYGAGLHQL